MKVEILRKFFDSEYIKFDFEWFSLCNRNCSYCYNTRRGPRESRSYEEITAALYKILNIKYEKLVLSIIGGEIILHPRFNDIINFIIKNKKPKHKFLFYTHAQHNLEFFKKKIEALEKMKDCTKVIVGLHFEDFKADDFEKCVSYIGDIFPVTMTTLLDDNFDRNFEWYKSFIERFPYVTIEPLIFDVVTDSKKPKTKIDIRKNFIQFKKLLPFKERMSMTYNINGYLFKTIEAKPILLNKFNFDFRGWDCFLRVYETMPNGDIYTSCDYFTEPLGNVFTDDIQKISDILTPIWVTCNSICEFNLCALNCKTKDNNEGN